MRDITDIVIVGSGAIGCATAFYLARGRARRVTLVEKGPLVSGMTRRNAGVIHTYHGDALTTRLATTSLSTFRHWSDAVGGSCGYVETGMVVPASTEAAGQVRQRVEMQKNAGADTRLLDRDELTALYPEANFEQVALAAYEPFSGYADPVQTAQTFAQRAREKGARLETGTMVKSVGLDRGRVLEVNTTTGTIETPVVIVAAGSWSERLLRPMGVSFNLQHVRGAIGFFQQSSNSVESHPIFLDAESGNFVRPHAYHLSAAALIDASARLSAPEDLDENVTEDEAQTLSAIAGHYLPALVNAPLKRSHTIVYDQPPDGSPVLGAVPGYEGLFIAAGFGENAFALAPAVGQLLAEWVVDGRPGIDLTAFSPARASLIPS